MALMSCELKEDIKYVVFKNPSAVTVPNTGINTTLTQVGTDDLSDYEMVGLMGVIVAGTNYLGIRGFNYTTKTIFIINPTSSSITVAAGYIEVTCAYKHK